MMKLNVLDEKPLVTFALIAYNQEQYIREAIQGAFSQTYSPLQIILSDDHSSDATFEIMEEAAKQYLGPHQITLNRNQSNQGIGGHVNKIMNLTRGDFVVVAAGDDISLPERTITLVKKWIELGRGSLSVHSSVFQIDPNGQSLGIKIPAKNFDGLQSGAIIGASHGWAKKAFDIYGELNPNLGNEDQAIGFRSYLLDGVHYIDQPLVQYRTGGVSDIKTLPDSSALLDYEQRRWSRYLILWKQMEADLGKMPLKNDQLMNRLQSKVVEFTLLKNISIANRPLLLLWRRRAEINSFVIKNAIKILCPNIFVRIQPVLNKLRR